MRRRSPSRVVAACLASLLFGATPLLAGCGSSAATVRVELTIYAASSLKAALDRVVAVYARAQPGVALTVSTDSSAALETKIEQGAPADLFLSADTANALKLWTGGFANAAPKVFATNKLTIIVPGGNPAFIESAADLAKPGIRIVAAGDSVPIAKYAKLVVQGLGFLPGYSSTFASDYARNVVTKVDSVAAVVAQVELGQADAGIVYVTDAIASTKVQQVELPDGANVTASYAGVVVKASTQSTAAQALLDWLLGVDGQTVLGSVGFEPPKP